jgi:hypothetical protein
MCEVFAWWSWSCFLLNSKHSKGQRRTVLGAWRRERHLCKLKQEGGGGGGGGMVRVHGW